MASWLLRLPRSLANSGDSRGRLLWQLGWVRQNGGGGAQVPEGVQRSWKTGWGVSWGSLGPQWTVHMISQIQPV